MEPLRKARPVKRDSGRLASMNWWGRAVKKSKARGTLLEPSMVLSETSAAAAREDARRVLLRLELIKARATIRAMRIARELRA